MSIERAEERIEKIDAAVIGGGPIGIEMAVALQEAGLDVILFEAKQIGEAIRRWPPHTRFFSTPEHVAIAGLPVQNLDQRAITGEEYLAYLRTVVEFYDLNLRPYEPVMAVERVEGGGFRIRTRKKQQERQIQARYVIFCTGGMARPNLLGIPGEDLPHVQHFFPGPHHYFRTKLLVVGGRNSALEAALRCWRAGAQVAVSYRRADIEWERVKPHLANDLQARFEKGEVEFLPGTIPVEITHDAVLLASAEDGRTPNGRLTRHECDFVLLATGFQADQSLLRQAGVELLGANEQPFHSEATMETNVPGLFVAGTAAGGTQASGFKYFISTTHDHVTRIVRHLTGSAPRRVGTVSSRNNAVTLEEVEAN